MTQEFIRAEQLPDQESTKQDQNTPASLTVEQKTTSEPTGPVKEIRSNLQHRTQSFYHDFKEQQEKALDITQEAADRSQEDLSERLHKVSGYVDRFFADDSYEQESKDSRMRISLTTRFQKHQDPTFQPRVNLSLALPNTKDRLRLRFQSNDEEDDEEEDNIDTSLTDSLTETTFATALGLIVLANESLDIRADLGVKFRTPLDPFSRLRLRRSFRIKNIEMRFTETFEWRDSRGKTADSRLEIEYPLNQELFFRTRTDATYWDIDSYWSGSQSLTLYDQLNTKSAIAYSIGISGQNEDELHLRKKDQVNNYWIEFRYRKNFYKNWLFYQITPGVDHPRDFEFSALPRIEFRLEALYGNLIK